VKWESGAVWFRSAGIRGEYFVALRGYGGVEGGSE
jgi:hypothetical protein